jgi:hypothetical protein
MSLSKRLGDQFIWGLNLTTPCNKTIETNN